MVVTDVIRLSEAIEDTLSSSVKDQLFCLKDYIIYWDFKIAWSGSRNLRFYDYGRSFFNCKKMQRLPTS